jgi:hypothetical protein
MIRTTLALAALTVFAGAAYAAPAFEPAIDTSLVISVVDDSTSESDAMEQDQNTLPSSPDQGAAETDPPAASSSTDDGEPMENKEYDRETNQ